MSRVWRAGAALAVAAAAGAGPGGAARPPAACAAAGSTRVAFAVDFGDAPGAPASGAVLTCVPVTGGTGADALAARARQLGTPAPRYAVSGLLCAIDGFPASGCGDRTGDHYSYWSYWHVTGNGWSYATGGPAGWQVANGDVEGWRYQDPGTGTAADPAPRGPFTASAICPAAPPPPPATTTTQPTAPSPPGTAPPATTRPNAPPTTAGQGGGASTPSSVSPIATAQPNPATTTTSAALPGSASPGPSSSVADAGATAAGRTGVALSPTTPSHRSGGGAPWSVILAAAGVALLGTGAWWRWRQGPGAA